MRSRALGSESLVGATLGSFRLVQHLGSGGTAHVYLAESRRAAQANERVALKVLRPDHVGHPAIASRFERESAAASRVRHENVLEVGPLERIEGWGSRSGDDPTVRDMSFFPMELLVGLDLADTLAYEGALSVRRVAGIGAQLCAGLEAAHAAAVVHRDVKPENVFLVHASDGRERVKIVDFGLASIGGDDPPETAVRSSGEEAPPRIAGSASLGQSAEVEPVGTPVYAAPEQRRGERGTPSADVYAAGVTLVEVLLGRLPGLLPGGAIDLDALRVPGSLRTLLASMTALDPADRPTIAEVLELLAHLGRA